MLDETQGRERPGDASPPAAFPRRALYASRFAGNMGQGLLFAGLFVVAGGSDSAAIELSGTVVAMIVAAILLGLPGGAVVDKVGPARGLVLGAALRVAVIFAGLSVTGHAEWLWAVAFAYSAASQVFSPAELALVRAIRLPAPGRAHALMFLLQHAGQGAGLLVVGPLLIVLGGAGAALWGAVIVNVAVTLAAVTLAVALRGQRAAAGLPVRRAFDLAHTVTFFARQPRATYAAGTLAFAEMASKVAAVAAPFYVAEELGLHGAQLLLPAAPVVAGVAAGLLWARRAGVDQCSLSTLRRILLSVVAGALGLAAFTDGLGPLTIADLFVNASILSLVLVIPTLLLLSLSLTVSIVAGRSVLTALAPTAQQARVFAAQGALTNILAVIPILAAGVGTQFVGARMSLLIIGGVGVAIMLALESAALQQFLDFRAGPLRKPSRA